MAKQNNTRRLAAILCADVASFSEMMGRDEDGTLAILKTLHRNCFSPHVAKHRGRIVKLMGDGALVEFSSVIDAITCATEVQNELASSKDFETVALRIGIHVGEIIGESGDIYGNGVNIAARLQDVAKPGGIALSGRAFDDASSQFKDSFIDNGPHSLKNISQPVHVFLWTAGKTPKTVQNAPTLPDKPSIVVLPFDNMSGDPDQEYFADGVVEAITATLSRIRSFFVIARNSAFAYKGRPVNVRQIGQELGVAYLLEGSVQKAGNRLRITVQLIETAGGAHIWAEKYDGALDDIFDLQDTITEQVAGAMQPSIRLAEVERSKRKRPQDLGAYDFTMRAMPHVWMLEQREAQQALELLDKALEIDPSYPLAQALAAWCWAQHSVYTWVEDTQAARKTALERAEKAASTSTDDPLILTILGTVHTFARNFGAARVLLERALQLDPNAAWTLSRLGWLDVYADRPDEAEAYLHRAMRLSPLDPMNFNNLVGLGSARQVAGDDVGAAEFFGRAMQERPNAIWVLRNHAAALYGSGRTEEAQQACARLLAAHLNFTVARFKEAMVFSDQQLERIGKQLEALGVEPG